MRLRRKVLTRGELRQHKRTGLARMRQLARMQRPLVTAAIRGVLEHMEARLEAPMQQEPEAAGGAREERTDFFFSFTHIFA